MTLALDHYNGQTVVGIETGSDSDSGPWYGLRMESDEGALIIVNSTEPPIDEIIGRHLASVVLSKIGTRMQFARGKGVEDLMEIEAGVGMIRVTDPARPDESLPETVIDDGSVEVASSETE